MIARRYSDWIHFVDFSLLVALVFASLLIIPFAFGGYHTYETELANAFWHGSLSLLRPEGSNAMTHDLAEFKQALYWPGGPAIGLLMLPTEPWLSPAIAQGLTRVLLSLLNGILLYHIARRLGIKRRLHAAILSMSILSASVYYFVANVTFTAYFVQLASFTFFVLALHEFLHRRRWMWVGVWLTGMLLSRPNTVLGALFFVLWIYRQLTGQKRVRAWFWLLAPLSLGLLALLLYNAARFGSPLEFGYHHQHILEMFESLVEKYGLFNIAYLPGNLYHFLLKTPLPAQTIGDTQHLQYPWVASSLWGMSIVFTSPWLLLSLRKKIASPLIVPAWITVGVMLIPILLYYGIGYIQYGFRYALDIYPLLFVLTVIQLNGKLDRLTRLSIVISLVCLLWLGFPIFL